MTFALIPAGGRSQRMGRPKLLLPLGDRTVLEQVLAALSRARIDQVLVVLGPQGAELIPLARARGAQVCLLPTETADMRGTVQEGLRWVEAHFHPRPEDFWLLTPADHPTLDPDVVWQLQKARTAHARHSIFLPTFEGQRGHPALIGWSHVAAIRAHPVGQGLNSYFRQQASQTLEVPVTNANILCDLDTPEEYERLRQRWEQ